MSSNKFAVGTKIFVLREGKTFPAVIIGELRSMNLVWIQVDGQKPSLSEWKDVVTERQMPAEDEISLWETEVFDTPSEPKPKQV